MAVSNREMEASTVVKWQKKASQDERERESGEREGRRKPPTRRTRLAF